MSESETCSIKCIIAKCNALENSVNQYATDVVTSNIDNIGTHARVTSVVTDAHTNTDSPIITKT